MGGTTFIVYKKDLFGIENHVSEINSYSAKLRHARRRQLQSLTSKKLESAVKQKIGSKEGKEQSVQPWHRTKSVMLKDEPLAEPGWMEPGSGMADPFSSTKIPVDINFYRVISFDMQSLVEPPSIGTARGRDQMNNGLLTFAQSTNTRHHTVVYLLGGRSRPAAEREETLQALENTATGYAFLSCRALVIADISKDQNMHHTALYFKQRAIEQLRSKLEEGKLQDNFYEKIKIVHSLFTAEIACGNLDAADVHGLALKYLLENDIAATLISSNPTVFQGVLWQEIQRAVLTMTQVTFDLNRWTQMLGLRLTYNYWESDRGRTDLEIGDGLVYEHLRPMMKEIMVLTHTPASDFADKPRPVLLRISAQALVLQGRLVNRYVGNMDLLSKASDQLSNIKEALQIESYLCLTILYWLRRAMFTEKSVCRPDDCTPYSARHVILERLRALLTASEPDHDIESPKARSRLFAMYIGAIAEQSGMREDDCLDFASIPYHNKKFVLQAVLMGLRTWSETQAILTDFLYHDGIGTAAQFWFEKVQNLFSRM